MTINVHAWGGGFDDLADQIYHMIHELQGHNYFRSHGTPTFKPNVNLYETREKYVLCIELAGVDPDRVDVQTEGGHLHVRGYRPKPDLGRAAGCDTGAEEVSVHQMEIDWGRYHRALRLPADVEVERVQATYRHGYLWILLPRRASGHGTS